MDVFEAIKSRRSVRAWTQADIPKETLSLILEAGRWSPSPLNSQPWHFIVIKNRQTIETLCSQAREGSFLKFANTCIVITAKEEVLSSDGFENEERVSLISWLKEHDQYLYSAVCTLQNMWLAAWSMGLGGCWVTVDKASTSKLLEIPDNEKIIGSLALGYILGTPVAHKDNDRKPLSEMVFVEKYGVREA